MNFKYPDFLYLLFLIPLIIFYYIYTFKKYKSGISFPSLRILKQSSSPVFTLIRHLLFVFNICSIIFLIFASSRPQGEITYIEKEVEIVDIMLLLDISESMNIIDIEEASRFSVALNVIKDFISQATSKRIGLIAFAGESYTLVPITVDFKIINSFLDTIEPGNLEDGTAIGMALANSAERLKNSTIKNRVVILLTDGENTAGSISPEQGLVMLKELGIRVYTIAFGTTGEVILRTKSRNEFTGHTYFYDRKVTSALGTEFLETLAAQTGGKFFRVLSRNYLVDVYNEINKLETSKVSLRTSKDQVEYFKHFVFLALVFLFLAFIIENLLFRVIP